MRSAVWTALQQVRLRKRPDREILRECAAPLAVPEGSGKSPAAAVWTPTIRVAAGLGEASSIDGERKTVTALFADIKGSTELMEDLDPEEARAIVDPALRIMVDAVRRYEGYVVQSTGDGIFALFGAPTAYEDHPQRALYAALQMQQKLRDYGSVGPLRERIHLKPASGLTPVKWWCVRSRPAATLSTPQSAILRISRRGCKRWRRSAR